MCDSLSNSGRSGGHGSVTPWLPAPHFKIYIKHLQRGNNLCTSFRDPGALSAMAVNAEDKENVPRSNHRALKNQLNSEKIIAPSSSNNSSNSTHHSGPQTHKLYYSRLSPITPSPPPLPGDAELSHSHDNESSGEQIRHTLNNNGQFLDAAAQCQLDSAGSVLADGHANKDRASSVSTATPSISDTEALRSTETRRGVREEEDMRCGSSVLGKRKSSERESNSSDDGYCTCGSCDSTPGGSAVTSTADCVCLGRVKRKEDECSSTREQLFSTEEPTCGTHVTDGCGDEFDCGDRIEDRVQTGCNSDTNVNDILEEFDRIFQSPEAVTSLNTEEKQLSAADLPQQPPSSPVLVSDYHCVQSPPSTLQSETRPVSQDSHQVTSSAIEEKPVIDLSVGLEEIAKREDEELKRAMEESLKQQVTSHNMSEFVYFSGSGMGWCGRLGEGARWGRGGGYMFTFPPCLEFPSLPPFPLPPYPPPLPTHTHIPFMSLAVLCITIATIASYLYASTYSDTFNSHVLMHSMWNYVGAVNFSCIQIHVLPKHCRRYDTLT